MNEFKLLIFNLAHLFATLNFLSFFFFFIFLFFDNKEHPQSIYNIDSFLKENFILFIFLYKVEFLI